MAEEGVFDLSDLVEALERPEEALRAIGLLLQEESRRAFPQQRLGDIQWPERYPGQDEPFISFAGALQDLNEGAPVKARRFERRPALRDRGFLEKGITHRVVSNDTVEVGVMSGPARQYAFRHQVGSAVAGPSVQPITETARKRLAQELREARGEKKRALRKLGFFFSVNTLETDVAERPFLGITPNAERLIPRIVEATIQGRSL